MWIEYLTIEEAQNRINQVNDICLHDGRWEGRGTDNYANPVERNGKYYVQVLSGYEDCFTENEINSSIELPEAIEN